MAFGAISTVFFPVAANAGSSLWGTDVRKLISSADAGNDASCKFAMGTSTSAHTVTADPYTSQGADLTEANYGWAIDPTDMGSVASLKRYMAAGNHVGTLRLQSTTNTNPTGTLTMFVYRVGDAAGGRVRTLLGSATITGQTFDTTIRTYTITVALAEILFEADETIQYSFELNGQGVAITGKNNSFYCGTIGPTPASVAFPTLQQVIQPAGFDVPVEFGTPALRQSVAPSGFDVAVEFGTPAVQQQVQPAGFDVTVEFGEPNLGATLAPDGFDLAVEFGDPTLVMGQVVSPDGFDVTVEFGDATLQQVVSPDGFDVGVEFGVPDLFTDLIVAPDGFDLNVDFGVPSVLFKPYVAGVVYNHETGLPVGAGVEVRLFDDNDVLVDTTTTAAGGTYVFERPFGDTDLYWTLATFEVSGVQYHGVSDRGCPAV